ncbi:MAG: WecB/TagA/CpsF family glycosyltransferase [Brevinematales bacterium]|nr:WecB/TagA/CpsF family glycosyltransferase [Brevinematales bacterium]
MLPVCIPFLSAKVSLFGRDDLKEYLVHTIYEKNRFRILILDEKKLFASFFSREVRRIIDQTEVVLCGSPVIAWCIRLLTGRHVEVFYPITILLDMLRIADEMQYSCYLLGGNKKVANEASKRIRRSFPNVRLLGYYTNELSEKQWLDVLISIRKACPQIFIVSFPDSVYQERWITKNFSYFSQSIILGIDASLDVFAGKKKMGVVWDEKRGWRAVGFSFRPITWLRQMIIIGAAIGKKIFQREEA